jgi:hypothetical protein
VKSIVVELYAGALRLYPRRFQMDYAEEMQAVFRQKLEDSPDTMSLYLREFGDLFVSIIREQVRERHKMKWFRYDRTQETRIVRWLIRAVSLLTGAFFFFTFIRLDQMGRLPPWGIPLVVVFALTVASTLIAWRWETLGGRLTMICAVALGLAGGYATYTYATTLPEVEQSSKVLVFLLAMAEWMIPFLIFGWLFVKVAQQTESVESPV